MVTGLVTDANNEPLPGVTVVLKNTSTGTTTESKGRFTLNVPESSANATLVFSYIGYLTREVALGARSNLTVQLETDIKSLNEVVVVGYGTVKKSDLTGSVSTVKADEIRQMPTVSLEQGLQGRAAGIQVTQASSAPGGGISVRIRGGNSINGGNEPLYVVDGFPIYNNNDEANPSGGRLGGYRTSPNALASLNPNDIESIEVLKDASATAVYGSRGANGVVLITTRRGKAGQGKVNLDVYHGVQQVDRTIDVLNGREFAQFLNQEATNLGQPQYYTPQTIPTFNNQADWNSLLTGEGTNWQKEIFQTAPISNYQLSFSGGSEKVQYAISGNYFNQDGVVKKSNFKRYSLRTNLDAQISNRFKAGTSLTVSRTLNNQIVDGGMGNANAGAVHASLQYLPILPIRLNNGLYSRREDEPSPMSPFGRTNPVQLIESTTDLTTSNRILGNIFGDFRILDGLNLRVTLGTDIDNRERDYYFAGEGERDLTAQGSASIGTTAAYSWINTNQLTYNKTFGAHQLTVTGVYELQQRTQQFRGMSNSIFVTDAFGFENIGAGTQVGGPGIFSSKNRWSLASYLGRISYIFKDKYLATLSARADGSSRFGANNKWGFFPSLALGWKLGEEPFIKQVRFISDLKLRASIGQIGNQEIGPYRSLTRITNSDYTFNRQRVTGLTPTAIGNPDLKWETTTQTDIGLDASLFNDRLSLTADYYFKKTTDLLFDISLPLNSGYSSTQGNVGNIQNQGIELTLGGYVLDGPLRWRTDLNWSANRSKVLALSTVNQVFGPLLTFDYRWRGNMLQVGEPVGLFYGYKTAGIFKTAEDVKASVQPTAKPGDVRYVDVNGDGKLDGNDRTVLGNPAPKFIYGWNNTFNYKNFELYFFFQGVYGNSVLNATKRDLYATLGRHNLAKGTLYDSWSPQNPGGTLPMIGGSGYNNTPTADEYVDFFVEDGSFLRLRNIRLGYTLPVKNKPFLKQARVYVAAQNVLTFTKYTGYNPEVNDRGQSTINQGIDFGAYPLAKTYMAGLTVEF
ncbi:SusC/RagA family TonB-linked outer membrane protein [Fibrisoma montanum]|nr:TonB-dependent receptor [Fibrisoma montanum]